MDALLWTFTILLGPITLSWAYNTYTVFRIMLRRQKNLLPDYRQIDSLRTSLAMTGGRPNAYSSMQTKKESILSSEKMRRLNQYITTNQYDKAWVIAEIPLEEYRKRQYIFIGGLVILAVTIFIAELFV